MEKNEIIESNRLIAEFMGFDRYSVILPIEGFLNKGPYHSSWDWLMPVIDRIEKIDELGNSTRINYSPMDDGHFCDILTLEICNAEWAFLRNPNSKPFTSQSFPSYNGTTP
jgi:hypothetical protein